jgi:cobalt-zinc-cadmium efflux system membrane fusion protein
MIQKLYFTFLALLFILFLTACGGKNTPSETVALAEEHQEATVNEVKLTEAQFKNAGIEIGTVTVRAMSGTITASGELEVPPQQMASIHAPMGGLMQKSTLLQGTFVKKGQVVAVLSNPDFVQMQQDYLEVKSQLEFAHMEYERQQELAKENVNAQKTLQQAKSNFNGLQAKSTGLAEKIRLLSIDLASVELGKIQSTINLYAPITGYVTEVHVNLGKFVSPSDLLFEIVDTRNMHVELKVFEKDLPRLRVGQKVRYQLANESKERTAKVSLLGREIDSDRTVRVHCLPQNEDGDLTPGLFLKANIETGAAETMALPDEAVVNFQGKYFIFSNGKPDEAEPGMEHFTMIAVQPGILEGGYTEVFLPEGFDKRTPIALKNAYSLLAKLKNSMEEEAQTH